MDGTLPKISFLKLQGGAGGSNYQGCIYGCRDRIQPKAFRTKNVKFLRKKEVFHYDFISKNFNSVFYRLFLKNRY